MPDQPESGIRMDEALRDELATQLAAVARALPDRINADPERVEQGLARLVLWFEAVAWLSWWARLVVG